MKSLFHGTGSVPTDVAGHLPLLAQLSGTLPKDMRDPDVSEDSYRQSLVCSAYWRFFYENALHKFTFDIDIDIIHDSPHVD